MHYSLIKYFLLGFFGRCGIYFQGEPRYEVIAAVSNVIMVV